MIAITTSSSTSVKPRRPVGPPSRGGISTPSTERRSAARLAAPTVNPQSHIAKAGDKTRVALRTMHDELHVVVTTIAAGAGS